MAQVLRKAVGDIDGRSRDSAQAQAEIHTRFRRVKALRSPGVPRPRKRIGCAAQSAGNPYAVARSRAVAPQGFSPRYLANYCHADAKRAPRGVASYQFHVEAPRQGKEPF